MSLMHTRGAGIEARDQLLAPGKESELCFKETLKRENLGLTRQLIKYSFSEVKAASNTMYIISTFDIKFLKFLSD